MPLKDIDAYHLRGKCQVDDGDMSQIMMMIMYYKYKLLEFTNSENSVLRTSCRTLKV